MKRYSFNIIIFVGIVSLYIIGQFLIGTYDISSHKFIYSAPADVDFLYYGAITNQLLNQFPPENPAFCDEKLTQPFLQYYPAALLAKFVNPYNAIRILNIAYLMIIGFLLRRYFPEKYGYPLIVIFAGSTLFPGLNSLGVDSIARGFTHVPSFIMFIVALHDRRLWLRLGAIFLAAFINGYLMLIFLPFLAILVLWKKNKEMLFLLIAGLIGLALASAYFSSEAVQLNPVAMLMQSIEFAPFEMVKHAIPILILGFVFFSAEMIILAAIAIIFGAFVQYNPFFPIFMVYFAGAMSTAIGSASRGWKAFIGKGVIVILALGFLYSTYQKYSPSGGDYSPRYDSKLNMSVDWILKNTKGDDSFMALTADERDLALITQIRPVYLGYIGHLSHLGLDWKARYEATMRFYQSGISPKGVTFGFYGPIEKKYFPGASSILAKYPIVYRDDDVGIYRLN